MLPKETVDRIRQMEQCFDALQKAANEDPTAMAEDPQMKELLQTLIAYYESGQWLQDYELDEKGLLPYDLKRGVLAQDAVYDFLDQIKGEDWFGCNITHVHKGNGGQGHHSVMGRAGKMK